MALHPPQLAIRNGSGREDCLAQASQGLALLGGGVVAFGA
jgi:hypothetical protein